jgi:hypothetical protein
MEITVTDTSAYASCFDIVPFASRAAWYNNIRKQKDEANCKNRKNPASQPIREGRGMMALE